MALTAGNSIVLGVTKPKVTAVTAVGAPTVAANELAIYVDATAPVTNVEAIVGGFVKLRNRALSTPSLEPDLSGSLVLSMPVGGGDASIVTTGHAAGLISLYVHGSVFTPGKSHFLDRTFKRLIELLLESAK